jgi:hypothetical protein
MQKVIATEFDEGSWGIYGLQWARSVKSAGYSGLVIDRGLPQQAKDKLSELKFRIVSYAEAGSFAALTANMEEEDRCMWCPPDFDFWHGGEPKFERYFAGDLSAKPGCRIGSGLACECVTNLSLVDLVMPIANIYKRADAALLIEKNGPVLSSRLICGGLEDWAKFTGYFVFLVKTAFLEARPMFEMTALNLYAASFKGCVVTIA